MSSSTAIKIAGGKVYLAQRLVALAPLHDTYLEPYLGGASFLLNKPYEGINEIACDIDGNLMNFWDVLRHEDTFAEFQRMCHVTPFSEELWQDQDDEQLSQGHAVERALAFFIRCRQSRSGGMTSFAPISKTRRRRGMNEQVAAWLSAIEGLPEIHARLRRVLLVCSDGVELLQKYDSPSMFAYLDPPYPHETRQSKKLYKHEMTEEKHEELLRVLGTLKGKFMLSSYPNEMYSEAMRKYGWDWLDFKIDNKLSSRKVKELKIERVYANYVMPPPTRDLNYGASFE